MTKNYQPELMANHEKDVVSKNQEAMPGYSSELKSV